MHEGVALKVMIVDDHTVVREGLALLLSTYDDLQVVALASDGEEAIARCSRLQPDVVLMDLSMPGVDGPTAIAKLRAQHPNVQCIALTGFLEEKLIQRALDAGAISYLLKSVGADRLAEAIRAAAGGESVLNGSAAQILVQAVTRPPPLGHDLTPREREVLALLATGKSNKQIGDALTLSHGTVRVYVSRILAKLGVGNRTEAVALAIRNNLLPDES